MVNGVRAQQIIDLIEQIAPCHWPKIGITAVGRSGIRRHRSGR